MGDEEISPYRKILLNWSEVVSSHPKAEKLRSFHRSHTNKKLCNVAEDGLIIYVKVEIFNYTLAKVTTFHHKIKQCFKSGNTL